MIQVSMIDRMGSDLSVVNAARVSFSKVKIEIDKSDERLINYLSKHNHWSPFAHTCAQFHIRAPIFIARQLAKHQVGLVWNEVSRRYVSDEPVAWHSEKNDRHWHWRKEADDKKQGSLEEPVPSQNVIDHMYQDACRHAVDAYNSMIKQGVCPEQARAVLPQSTYTEWYWTGSVYAFSRVCKLRIAEDAQRETRYVAEQIGERMKIDFPLSWKALLS